jgi:predicted esterase
MNEHHINFSFRGRYYTSAPITAATRHVWFVLHGYGQLGKYFIRKFAALESKGIVVIAPESLSRFYLEDPASRAATGNNRVGATWMTKEDRETDILNYITFLNEVYRTEINNRTDIDITLLGFSQGAATVSRWAVSGKVNFRNLVLWAGVFPTDLQLAASPILKEKRVVVVFGTKDPFRTSKHEVELKSVSMQLGIEPEIVTFDGGHEIDEDTLLRLSSIKV